jgi:ABC-2 type transport system permease protein
VTGPTPVPVRRDEAPRPTLGDPPVPAQPVRLGPALAAVYAGQLARARTSRGPVLIVATLQSVGLLLLFRGVLAHTADVTARSVVAGSTVLVIAFVALNLLAQRLGALRAGGLDYYAALPVPAAAVVLGIAASYAAFTVPGAVLTGVLGVALYGLPFAHLWVLAPVLVLAGAALAGLGAFLGLVLPRPELATLAGQLGMTAVLFLGLIPAPRFPIGLRVVRAAVPSTYGVDALAGALRANPSWPGVAGDLGICAAVAVGTLTAAGWAYRRAVAR